jgi:hypothetical protein
VNDSITVAVASPQVPTVNLSASPSSLTYNGSTLLSWNSSNATSCTATGDWSGSQPLSGSLTINALIADSSFDLTCSGAGGSANDSVNVTIAAPPIPTIALTASPDTVSQNGSTTLNWSSTDATSCTASGDWSGSKAVAGSEAMNSLVVDSQFTLTCDGVGGAVNDTVNVTVVVNNNGTALLSWSPPTENTDGSTLTDLTGYKIYFGTSSGNYGSPVIINNPGLSSYLVEDLAMADWYFSIKVFNSSGTESDFSAEVSKTIN